MTAAMPLRRAYQCSDCSNCGRTAACAAGWTRRRRTSRTRSELHDWLRADLRHRHDADTWRPAVQSAAACRLPNCAARAGEPLSGFVARLPVSSRDVRGPLLHAAAPLPLIFPACLAFQLAALQQLPLFRLVLPLLLLLFPFRLACPPCSAPPSARFDSSPMLCTLPMLNLFRRSPTALSTSVHVLHMTHAKSLHPSSSLHTEIMNRAWCRRVRHAGGNHVRTLGR